VNVAACQLIKDMVEPMFPEMLPGPLKSLHFTKLDLGGKACRFDNADVHNMDTSTRGMEGDTIKLDLDVHWAGEMDIEMACGALGFGIQHVTFVGRLSVLMRPLVPILPLVGAMQIAFINPPAIEFDMTGLAQVADFSGVDSAVRGIIDDIIAGMLVLPNRMLVKVDPANDYYATYLPPMGLIRIKIETGTGFSTQAGLIKDVPDLYCAVKFGANKTWNTSTKDNDEAPEWNEKNDFLLSDHDQLIAVQVFDSDIGGDDLVGLCQTTVSDLILAGKKLTLPLLGKNKPEEKTGATITISCEILDLSTDPSSIPSNTDAINEAQDRSLSCGLLTILIPGAKALPGDRSAMQIKAMITAGEAVFNTAVVKDMPGIDVQNPCFDAAYRVLLTPEIVKGKPDIKMTLFNKAEELGTFTVEFADVLDSPNLSITSKHMLEGGGTFLTKIFASGLVLKR
jgi:Ca2+-dependent lipid-binding protein